MKNKKLENKYKATFWSLIGLIIVFIYILIRGWLGKTRNRRQNRVWS